MKSEGLGEFIESKAQLRGVLVILNEVIYIYIYHEKNLCIDEEGNPRTLDMLSSISDMQQALVSIQQYKRQSCPLYTKSVDITHNVRLGQWLRASAPTVQEATSGQLVSLDAIWKIIVARMHKQGISTNLLQT